MVDMLLTCHLKLKIKSKTECPFLRHKLFVKIKHLSFLPTVNPPLEGFVQNFDRFLPSSYKFGTVYMLAYRCSSWTKLHTELVCVKQFS